MLRAVALDDLADRAATKLSGGQQQRLALARALVMEPQLLLLDEPLSNLDAKLRERMRFELKRIQRELGLTTVYVTHDQTEALALSHMIAVMNQGRIVQIGTPRDIYERPSDRFVADFVGTTNFLDAIVVASGGEGALPGSRRAGRPQRAMRRAPDVRTTRSWCRCGRRTSSCRNSRMPHTDGDNFCAGTVLAKAFLGDCLDFQVKIGDFILLARVHPSLRTPVGDRVYVRMRAEKCIAVPNRRGGREGI